MLLYQLNEYILVTVKENHVIKASFSILVLTGSVIKLYSSMIKF